MLKPISRITLIATFLTVCAALAGTAAEPEYKTYQRPVTRQLLFKLIFDDDSFGYVLQEGDVTSKFLFSLSDLHVQRNRVTAADATIFENDALVLGDERFPLDEITDIQTSEEDDFTVLAFYTRPETSRTTERIRRGNVISPTKKVIVEDGQFVRGLVLTVTADIDVYGEVNEDVVALFGDVFVGPDAVIRGDIASITGEVDITRDASIYGDVLSPIDHRRGRYYRFRRGINELEFIGTPVYNRVDGLRLSLGMRYVDTDSLLPTVWLEGGYAFESERGRFDLGIEQTLMRRPALALGGTAYRRLASDDDWLITDQENNVYTLLFREDWKDYYEAEGARAYIKSRPIKELEIQAGYQYEETNWLYAERDLWSLFGGDKKFRRNFSSVDSLSRARGIQEIDTSVNGALYFRATLDTRDKDHPYDYPGWLADGFLEWSDPNFDSDFDYRRYRLSLVRYQPCHRRTILLARLVYGGSDGYLPMHKRFYLGGLGTLYGYEHKEYSGDRFWMGNLEYRVDFPRTGLAASVFWDVGEIASGSSFEGSELKHSLGVSVYLGEDFKVMLAKRLDRGEDDDPIFYARFAHGI